MQGKTLIFVGYWVFAYVLGGVPNVVGLKMMRLVLFKKANLNFVSRTFVLYCIMILQLVCEFIVISDMLKKAW